MKRWIGALLVLVIVALLVAMPAIAVADDGVTAVAEEVLTWEALGTIAGAAAAATIVAQVMLAVAPAVTPTVVRIVMLLVALGLAEVVALLKAPTLESGVVAAFVGLSAALTAMKAYETLKHGIGAVVSGPEV